AAEMQLLGEGQEDLDVALLCHRSVPFVNREVNSRCVPGHCYPSGPGRSWNRPAATRRAAGRPPALRRRREHDDDRPHPRVDARSGWHGQDRPPRGAAADRTGRAGADRLSLRRAALRLGGPGDLGARADGRQGRVRVVLPGPGRARSRRSGRGCNGGWDTGEVTIMKTRKTPVEGGSAWRWYAEPAADRDYLAMATFIELGSVWNLPRFEWYTLRVHRQLARTPGL